MANKKISDLEEALSTDGFYVSTSNSSSSASNSFTITAGLVTKDTDHVVESPTGSTNSGDMVLFGSKNPTTGAIIYRTIGLYFEVYQSSTFYKQYVPKATSLGIGCMYEEVEGKYYYNKGTGNFTIV